MGPTTAALAQFILSLVAEGIREAAFALAFHTLDLNIRHFARGSKLTESKLVAAVALAPMDELNPWEIIQMPMLTGHEKAGRHDRGGLGLPHADAVDVPATVSPIGIELQLEEARLERSQKSALGTNVPSRERGHRDANVRRFIERAGGDPGGLACHRRGQQFRHLLAQLILDGPQQTWLADLGHALVDGPVFEPHDHHREAGQFDDRANPIVVKQLAGADLADLATVGAHGAHDCSSPSSVSSSSLTAGTKLGSLSSPPSWRIKPTFGSTSRSEFRHVKSSHSSRPGRFSRPAVMPSRSSS